MFVGIADDLDIVMLMHNLSKYSGNYSMTLGSLWSYYRVEVNDATKDVIANSRLNDNKRTTS